MMLMHYSFPMLKNSCATTKIFPRHSKRSRIKASLSLQPKESARCKACGLP